MATEAQLQNTIREAALANGWLYYHTHDSRRSDSGFPDVICIRHGRIVVFELKIQKGKVSMEQLRWLTSWEGCGAYSRVVRPEPKASNEISYDDAVAILGGNA
jgi:Holliday junction resolvase